MSDAEGVALVVPSLRGEVSGLLDSLARQTLQPAELEIVTHVRPNGRARNLGVERTRSPIVVFVDDDAALGAEDTLARLVEPLSDPGVGASGCAKLIPPGSSRFQRRVAREVPRIEHPVSARTVEANPPVGRHGYTDITTTCCAMRREVLERCGGFDERLFRGTDSELFYRVRRAGYRLVLVAGAWAWHAAPATVADLLAKHFAYGIGYAQEVQKHPERAAGRYLHTWAHAVAYVLLRSIGLIPHVFLPGSYAGPQRRPGFKPLRALAGYAAGLGYVYGWYRRPYRAAGVGG
jgi:GT2 family glycosyltransferase